MKNKINVNISPNPLDLQTLHCSQNDTGERKFYFTLHNNGEVIDTTDISDPIFEPFDVHKGGTEQLLPINTDDPTTSPIIADIQYPDEEKTEQEFTYRESPTTLDGKALIEKIKGNTLVWNQLVQNGNFADSTGWNGQQATLTVSNNEATITGTANYARLQYQTAYIPNVIANHKYLLFVDVKKNKALSASSSAGGAINIRLGDHTIRVPWDATSVNAWKTYSWFVLPTSSSESATNTYFYLADCGTAYESGYEASVRNVNLFDLTAMFGSTKADEIYAMEQSESGSGVAYFRSLFPLPYYQYGQKLLSFNGTGIKTTNRNVLDINRLNGATGITVTDGVATGNASSFYTATNGNVGWSNILFKPNTTYFVRAKFTVGVTTWMRVRVKYTDGAYGNGNQVTSNTTGVSSFLSNSNKTIENIIFEYGSQGANPITVEELCCYETSTGETEYIPYESKTISIPTSTYFPNGMMGVGTAFDELTNSKATHRMGEYTFTGNEEWTASSTPNRFSVVISNYLSLPMKSQSIIANAKQNVLSSKYGQFVYVNQDKVAYTYYQPNIQNTVLVLNDSSLSTVADVQTATTGMKIQYELDTEQVTEFTQASLICEDGESTLYQDDDCLVCECTEDFSKESGFKDCKIKFTNDDGVVYSNKIQLHIERKP